MLGDCVLLGKLCALFFCSGCADRFFNLFLFSPIRFFWIRFADSLCFLSDSIRFYVESPQICLYFNAFLIIFNIFLVFFAFFLKKGIDLLLVLYYSYIRKRELTPIRF